MQARAAFIASSDERWYNMQARNRVVPLESIDRPDANIRTGRKPRGLKSSLRR